MESPSVTGWRLVVPVKGGRGAKSRLRRSLDDGALVAAIVHDTLAVAARVVGPAGVLVVTSDPDETAYAAQAGFTVVGDPGGGLDAACTAGVRAARAEGAGPVAILLGDHPGLTEAELVAVLDEGSRHDTFFVPDAEGTGTALLGASGRAGPAPAFGPGSAARHLALGHHRLDLDLPGLRHDVDDEVSLRHALANLSVGPRTLAALGR
ncbi:2-phospho-L-lactate guanylyltransferase [Knoellia aerolata]|uniref:2-phospho-L-lactate guanylyltransferase n=1 Tax=Knoellia aerolata DSM 18566 TaxID=1385519 RepID=A0A0A0JZQ0_9MICO|nr:2-phospho-L-lactate guanylyltransferase [Knoellia aerolata]KGN42668.1 2-phospho-L-lactate guanylyltransferase [Knoellia aerolata DSM 18566]